MKKLLFLFLIAIAAGCSSDDASRSVEPTLIVGKWEHVSIVTGGGQNVPLNDCDTGVSSEFKANNTVEAIYVCSGSQSSDVFEYSVSGDVLTYVVPDELGEGQDYIVKYNILDLSASTLKIKEYYNNESGNNNGNTITFSKIN